MEPIATLGAALTFGGMTLFSFGFAPALFQVFDTADARRGIRGTFPHYYLFVVACAGVTAVLCLGADSVSAVLFAAIAVSTVFARQVLMPLINAATDAGNRKRFNLLHGASVVLQLAQIGLAAWAVLRLAA